ncbi:pirin family protein [Mycoplasma sp. P36-A1]|uniref:pirin family protein n=1 Tax=Mycoplasma sp. P36-A1 TaxID=3252900 RepID=UPI003C2BC6A1
MITIHTKEKFKKNKAPFWLDTYYHFSFADYYAPNKMNYGVLQALNDDLILPMKGFDAHAHKNIEILSYVVSGTLTHIDNLKNKTVLKAGSLQFIHAGTGIMHSERNKQDTPLQMITMFVTPKHKNTIPKYDAISFTKEERHNNLLHMVGSAKNAFIKIDQDINLYVCESEKNKEYNLEIKHNRQAYIVCLSGEILLNNKIMFEHDAASVIRENLVIQSTSNCSFLIIEMLQDIDIRNLNKFFN